jgi:hypothetical protein
MGAPEFFRKAHRIAAYQGAVRMRVEMEAREREEAPEDVTPASAVADPGMAGLIDFG